MQPTSFQPKFGRLIINTDPKKTQIFFDNRRNRLGRRDDVTGRDRSHRTVAYVNGQDIRLGFWSEFRLETIEAELRQQDSTHLIAQAVRDSKKLNSADKNRLLRHSHAMRALLELYQQRREVTYASASSASCFTNIHISWPLPSHFNHSLLNELLNQVRETEAKNNDRIRRKIKKLINSLEVSILDVAYATGVPRSVKRGVHWGHIKTLCDTGSLQSRSDSGIYELNITG